MIFFRQLAHEESAQVLNFVVRISWVALGFIVLLYVVDTVYWLVDKPL